MTQAVFHVKLGFEEAVVNISFSYAHLLRFMMTLGQGTKSSVLFFSLVAWGEVEDGP